MEWKSNILTTDDDIREVLVATKTIAVLGIKPESHAGQPAFYVPKYMADAGYQIIPVPVYYPDLTEILGSRFIAISTRYPARSICLTCFGVPKTSKNTRWKYFQKSRKRYGFSSVFATTRSPSNWLRPG